MYLLVSFPPPPQPPPRACENILFMRTVLITMNEHLGFTKPSDPVHS